MMIKAAPIAAPASDRPGTVPASWRATGLRIEVDALEAIDRTPVVDVKPAIGPPA
jgi:hypothetical protein